MEKKQTIDFIGNGSCFNTEFGNNAAYYKEEQGKRLLLIDCGESIFERVNIGRASCRERVSHQV